MMTYERFSGDFDPRTRSYQDYDQQGMSEYSRETRAQDWYEGAWRSRSHDSYYDELPWERSCSCNHDHSHRSRTHARFEEEECGGNYHDDFRRRTYDCYEREFLNDYGYRSRTYEGYEDQGRTSDEYKDTGRTYDGYQDIENGVLMWSYEGYEPGASGRGSQTYDGYGGTGRTQDGHEETEVTYDGYKNTRRTDDGYEGKGTVGRSRTYEAYDDEDIGRRSRTYDDYGDELPVEFGRKSNAHNNNFKSRKRRRKDGSFPSKTQGGVEKYHAQRYRLFSLFDEGVKMDKVSWYSVTPEKIAIHIAQRFQILKPQVIVDAFCGAAGNAIQFAKLGLLTIAVELCQSRIDIARNNAAVYGVERNIEFVNGNTYQVLPSLKGVDAVFLSPPWGGPMYQEGPFQLSVFKDIVEIARKVTPNVAILVPKNISHEDALETFGRCEIEHNFLGSVLKTVTIYFGGLIRTPEVTSSS